MSAASGFPGAGLQKLCDCKYLAPVAGVREKGLALPERVLAGLRTTEGYNTDRARVAPPSEETLGLYSGALVDLEPERGLDWGVEVPAAEHQAVTRRVKSVGSEYVEMRREEPVDRVVITFADDNRHAAAAFDFDVVSYDGFTVWRDR